MTTPNIWTCVADDCGYICSVFAPYGVVVTLKRRLLSEVCGRSLRARVQEIAQQLNGGQEPEALDDGDVQIFPLAAVAGMEIDGDSVLGQITFTDGKDAIPLTLESHDAWRNMAKAIADNCAGTVSEARQPCNLVSALSVPVVCVLIASLTSAQLIGYAIEHAKGGPVVANGVGRNKARAEFLISVARLLGTEGCVLAALLTVGACLAWMLRAAILRPDVVILEITPRSTTAR